MPNLRNLAMELRKVCCHPWLCNGLEDDMMLKRHNSGNGPADTLEALVHSSGKMLLLHKLLPKLQAEGRKVYQCLAPATAGVAGLPEQFDGRRQGGCLSEQVQH